MVTLCTQASQKNEFSVISSSLSLVAARWASASSTRNTILAILFCGAWEIWKTRCRLKYDGELYNGTTILRRVYNLVHDITIMHKPKQQASTFDKICLEGLALPVRSITVQRGKWVWWNKPQNHEYKLNMDGSKKGVLSAGGGVVRNRHDDFVCGFSAPYDVKDIVEAELQALVDGLDLSHAQGLDNIIIESDSALVVKVIKEAAHSNWRYVYLSRKVKSRLQVNDEVRWIYIEQNKAADLLAKNALELPEKKDFFSCQEVSPIIRKMMFLDRICIPNFRLPCK